MHGRVGRGAHHTSPGGERWRAARGQPVYLRTPSLPETSRHCARSTLGNGAEATQRSGRGKSRTSVRSPHRYTVGKLTPGLGHFREVTLPGKASPHYASSEPIPLTTHRVVLLFSRRASSPAAPPSHSPSPAPASPPPSRTMQASSRLTATAPRPDHSRAPTSRSSSVQLSTPPTPMATSTSTRPSAP